jgi:acyl-CoA synthetase (AMP-forming)/AMP-acid ligase II
LILYEDLRDMAQSAGPGVPAGLSVSADDIFTICWTSGTETHPKGCPLSHNNWAGIAYLQDAAGLQPGDKMLTAGPLVNMAYVVPAGEQTVTLEDIINLLDEKGVAKYKHPERLEMIASLPRNPVGKILNKELRQDILKKLKA